MMLYNIHRVSSVVVFTGILFFHGDFLFSLAKPIWTQKADVIVYREHSIGIQIFLRAPQSIPHEKLMDKIVRSVLIFLIGIKLYATPWSIFCALRNRRMLHQYGMMPYCGMDGIVRMIQRYL